MALIIEIKVVPQSAKSEIVVDKNGMLKCFLKNPPLQGKANDELIKFFAKALSMKQSDIRIIRGLAHKKKTIKLDTALTIDEVYKAFGLKREKQGALF